jgi:hypothetical protein
MAERWTITLFRLIRVPVVGFWHCNVEPHSPPTLSAGVDQSKPFQMKQIVL